MSRIRLWFTAIILLFLIGAGAAWVLSNQGIIHSSWAPSLGTAFSVLAVLVAFVQWTIPLPPSETKTPPLSTESGQTQEIFIEKMYDRLRLGGGYGGVLVVYEKRDNIGEEVTLRAEGESHYTNRIKTNIVERIVNGRSLAAAVFYNLKPNDYLVFGPGPSGPTITVVSGQVAEVDRRNVMSYEERQQLEEKAKQRKSTQAALRVQSVMIGLGGILFLAHLYMRLPYFDVVGIILLSWGVLNLLFSSILNWLEWLQGEDGILFRSGLIIAELGGVLLFVHRYMAVPYLDIAGIVVIILSVIWVIGWGLAS